MSHRTIVSLIILIGIIQINQITTTVSSSNNEPEDQRECPKVHLKDEDCSRDCYRAAIFEHNRIDLNHSIFSAEVNLEMFRRVAELAAKNGANIIVFPEDGIVHGSKKYITPTLHEIPDPEVLDETNNNPCETPDKFTPCFILSRLSCIARDNRLYVVANFGTKHYCEIGSKVGEITCPQTGFLAFNTDVVLDPKGNFIKRYRKYNLFVEIFDRAPTLENVYFDTPFGRFGIFTCFDMMFRQPAISLVEDFNIDTALFPTWWFDELPFLSAIQFQDGWSATNKVNLLAANMHRLNLGSTGSGIYSGPNSVYVGAASPKPRLVMANLPKKTRQSPSCQSEFNPLVLDVETDLPESVYRNKQYELLPSDSIYALTGNGSKQTICNKQVCCTVDYKMSTTHALENSAKVILIVRDGLRPGNFHWYEQVCGVVTLEEPFNPRELSKTTYSRAGLVRFDRLLLSGTFETPYVYPITAHNVSHLISRADRRLTCDPLHDKRLSCKLNYTGTSLREINTFAMYARLYEGDKMS